MWLLLGSAAILATLLNLLLYFVRKDYRFVMALSLSLTALTLCSFYSMISRWTLANDWSALLDVVPYMDTALWYLTMISIILNMTPITLEYIKKKFS